MKNTIPLDLDGFEWLAKTTDNLILMTQKLKQRGIED
jgi:hypothetical protein